VQPAAPAGASAVMFPAETRPAPSTSAQKPGQLALAVPAPGPASAASAQAPKQLTSVAPSTSDVRTPAVTEEWKDRVDMLKKRHGQLSYSKAMALLLDIKNEKELESLIKYQALLERMPYQSALVLGVNDRGFLVWRRTWGQNNLHFATKDLLDFCNARATEGSCRLVVINGEFQEKAFLEVVALLGRQTPDFLRRQYVVNGLPRDFAVGTSKRIRADSP